MTHEERAQMIMEGNLLAPIKRHHGALISCGVCKGTGVEHEWKMPDMILIPTGNVCPNCDGSGALPTIQPPQIRSLKDKTQDA